MRIVIVEDEVKIREGMGKMIMNQTGHIIVGEAADGEEGLEMIHRFKPDLVVTDIRMPKMDGLEMVRRLSEEKCRSHIVILSGYSEFDYAKRALQYGAEDYLLKPLAAEDVQGMLGKIEDRIREKEEWDHGVAQDRIKSVLLHNEKDDDEKREKIRRDCGLEPGMKYCMAAGYIGMAEAGYRSIVEKGMAEIKMKFPELKVYLVYHENTQIIYCLAMGMELCGELLERYKTMFYHRMISLYKGKKDYPIWTEEAFTEQWIGDVAETLRSRLSYALVLGNELLLTEEMVTKYKPEAFQEPKEIENRLKHALRQGNYENIEKEGENLIGYLRDHRFHPTDIRDTVVKSYHMITETLRDSEQAQYNQLVNGNIIRELESAVTFREMEEAFKDLTNIIAKPKIQREDISNFVIRRAIDYIREHYQEGLTLEEVARKLDITPEYLSTLFNREVGINFSTFLKRFRLSHAKRMLKGSDMKIYEIAQSVGYSDAKYFARVFKEEEGISPGDYRQMN